MDAINPDVLEDAWSARPAEYTVRLSEDLELFYRAWLPDKPTDRVLVLFHRGHEHSGRWQETVEALGLQDVAVFAWDARGHGHSSGKRGAADHLSAIVSDMDRFIRHLTEIHGIPVENMIILAHSVGAVAATAWVHDYAPPIRALILATPAFRVRLYVPLAIPLLRLRQKLFGHGFVNSYVKARMLTHDSDQAKKYDADPLIFRQIAVNVLLDLYDTSTRLIADAGTINVPVLMFTADADWVVNAGAQRRFFENLSSPSKAIMNLPGFFHAVFHENDRHIVTDRIRDFVQDQFRKPRLEVSLLDADKNGFTKSEYDRLKSPGNPVYTAVRSILKSMTLSEGMRLGWKAGFDSGLMLDYVYENTARGKTFVGRFIDRILLDSVGWRGIRIRRDHMETALGSAIREVSQSGPVKLIDIASGPGRYVLQTVSAHDPSIAVHLRDYQPDNIAAAHTMADELGLTGVSVEQGDAFDRGSLAATRPRPNIAIASGIFELFPDNEPVLRSLRGLGDAIETGGYLIYTNQPWHPQLEFIARVLVNREGRPWIMRRRSQAEMDQLVRAAGFEKISQRIDPWGIFTVSVARKVAGGA